MPTGGGRQGGVRREEGEGGGGGGVHCIQEGKRREWGLDAVETTFQNNLCQFKWDSFADQFSTGKIFINKYAFHFKGISKR